MMARGVKRTHVRNVRTYVRRIRYTLRKYRKFCPRRRCRSLKRLEKIISATERDGIAGPNRALVI